jgi:putative endonuclease
MFYVYILLCKDSTLYVGSTNNLEKRLKEHNTSKSGAHYTKIRRPVTLQYHEVCDTYAIARAREAEIKRLTREKKLKLIESKPWLS